MLENKNSLRYSQTQLQLKKVILSILMYLICSNISAQKYKKLYETNDLQKLTEKIDKAYKKDSANLLLIYYKSKILSSSETKNLNESYLYIDKVCNLINDVEDVKLKEQFLEDDLSYSYANEFKQKVCLLILDSIEKNSSQIKESYKSFIRNYSCEVNEKVKFKIDEIEFLELKSDSNIQKCDKYLAENNSSFQSDILRIIEYKTYQSIIKNEKSDELCLKFINRFPNSIFSPEITYLLYESKIAKAYVYNDTNRLNIFKVELNKYYPNSYTRKAAELIEQTKEKIYYQLCENKKDKATLNLYLNTFRFSVHYDRVIFIKDSIENENSLISLIFNNNPYNPKSRFKFDTPKLNLSGFINDKKPIFLIGKITPRNEYENENEDGEYSNVNGDYFENIYVKQYDELKLFSLNKRVQLYFSSFINDTIIEAISTNSETYYIFKSALYSNQLSSLPVEFNDDNLEPVLMYFSKFKTNPNLQNSLRCFVESKLSRYTWKTEFDFKDNSDLLIKKILSGLNQSVVNNYDKYYRIYNGKFRIYDFENTSFTVDLVKLLGNSRLFQNDFSYRIINKDLLSTGNEVKFKCNPNVAREISKLFDSDRNVKIKLILAPSNYFDLCICENCYAIDFKIKSILVSKDDSFNDSDTIRINLE